MRHMPGLRTGEFLVFGMQIEITEKSGTGAKTTGFEVNFKTNRP